VSFHWRMIDQMMLYQQYKMRIYYLAIQLAMVHHCHPT
jgi:hypothetical protein